MALFRLLRARLALLESFPALLLAPAEKSSFSLGWPVNGNDRSLLETVTFFLRPLPIRQEYP